MFSAFVDLVTVMQAAGHVSFVLFKTYPFGLSPWGYFALRASDLVLHFVLFARDGDPFHLALYASHFLKGANVPLLRDNVYINAADALSYVYTMSKIKDLGVFAAGCVSYVMFKTRGWIW